MPTESSARSARQTRAVIHRRHHYYRYLNPVVIMDRHPADEPSVLQVEIDGAPGPLSALCNVFKKVQSLWEVEGEKEMNSDGEKRERESEAERRRMKTVGV